MEKEKKAEVRKLRKKAIRLQNTSSVKVGMAEAMRRVRGNNEESK